MSRLLYRVGHSAGRHPWRVLAVWLDAERTTFHGSPEGSVDLVTPGEETRAALSLVFDAWRTRHVGEIRRQNQTISSDR